MAGFLYFLPDVPPEQVTPERIRSIGLEPAFREQLGRWEPSHNVVVQRLSARGPKGSGSLLFHGIQGDSDFRTPGYNPSEQEWKDCGAYCLGVDTERRPTPEALQREEIVDGYPVELHGGAEWIVPLIRSPFQEPVAHVPHVAVLGNGGALEMEIDPAYLEAWKDSAVAWDMLIGSRSSSFREVVELCARLLGVNYRVGLHECLFLRLFNSNNGKDVLTAVCNKTLIDEVAAKLKKKADATPESLSTTPGEKGAIPATDPAAQPST